MKMKLEEITVRELVNNYQDDEEGGVIGYADRLNIRPQYQREFVYEEKQRNAVIDTIIKDLPLNMIYWIVREDGNFEVLDGQQRTISVCQYVHGDFAFKNRYFPNLQTDEQEQILDYKLMVWLCSGSPKEKMEWYHTINIPGKVINKQELRNAVFAGPWVSDARRYFSKTSCPAYGIGSDYLNGSAIRQDYLQTVIKWKSGDKIEEYMGKHQYNQDAEELWLYFTDLIDWVKATFTVNRPIMKCVDWGSLYNKFKDIKYNPKEIEEETAKLLLDDEVQKQSGIYPYILTRDEKYLSIRTFTNAIKQKVYEIQKGKCMICGDAFEISAMEGDHIKPWCEGGKTVEENCQMTCKSCNRAKGAK